MILKEFFGNPIKVHKDQKEEKPDGIKDDLFWYILDHDRLHKDYFFPIAKKIRKMKDCGPEKALELYMPMVVRGCKEYYNENKMQGKLGKCFPVKMREDLCHRLHDHYLEDIRKGKYKLG